MNMDYDTKAKWKAKDAKRKHDSYIRKRDAKRAEKQRKEKHRIEMDECRTRAKEQLESERVTKEGLCWVASDPESTTRARSEGSLILLSFFCHSRAHLDRVTGLCDDPFDEDLAGVVASLLELLHRVEDDHVPDSRDAAEPERHLLANQAVAHVEGRVHGQGGNVPRLGDETAGREGERERESWPRLGR